MGTLSGEATLSVSSLPPYKLGSSHKGKNLLLLEQILSLREDPILRRLRPPGKRIESQENCLPLKTWRKTKKVHPYTLNYDNVLLLMTNTDYFEQKK